MKNGTFSHNLRLKHLKLNKKFLQEIKEYKIIEEDKEAEVVQNLDNLPQNRNLKNLLKNMVTLLEFFCILKRLMIIIFLDLNKKGCFVNY